MIQMHTFSLQLVHYVFWRISISLMYFWLNLCSICECMCLSVCVYLCFIRFHFRYLLSFNLLIISDSIWFTLFGFILFRVSYVVICFASFFMSQQNITIMPRALKQLSSSFFEFLCKFYFLLWSFISPGYKPVYFFLRNRTEKRMGDFIKLKVTPVHFGVCQQRRYSLNDAFFSDHL